MKPQIFGFAFLVITFLLSACNARTSEVEATKTEFYVRGNCGMCKERIETAVMHVKGVKAADWNVDSQMLNVTFDSTRTDVQTLNKAVAGVGHETKLAITPKEVHDKLPVCCQKGKM